VTERLAAREVEHGDGSWDSWRTDEGTWMVALAFTAGTRARRACWSYDAQLRHVTPQDDEARWLTDAEPPAADPGAAVHRRLVPIRTGTEAGHDRLYDLEADGGIRPGEGAPAGVAPWPAASTVDLLDSLRERRGRRQRPIAGPAEGVETDADLPAVPRPQSPPPAHPAHPARSRPEPAADADVLALPEPESPPPAAAPAGVPADASAGRGETASKPPTTRRSKRASVPSWDDIVFGGRRE
jgi:hypothetical protein